VDTQTIPPPPVLPPPLDEATFSEIMARIRALHSQILARRGGIPVEVDDVLDELRGRT
jgi:hypothetical protein